MQAQSCHVSPRAFASGPSRCLRPVQQTRGRVPARQPTRCEVARPGGGAREDELSQSSAAAPASAPEVQSLEFPAPNISNAAAASAAARDGNPIKTSGLRRTPLSGGVQNATLRCDLPSPVVAVRNLVEQAQFAHLCTIMCGMHHRRAGYPFGSLVDFAADGAGHPIFSLSPLAIQTRNLLEDPRCSVVVQMPGWTGLANARVTIFGDVHKLPTPELQEQAQEIFHAKHSTRANRAERYVSGNSLFFRMNRILDIYFVGGYGSVQWVDVEEYSRVQPDPIVLTNPNQTLQVLNETYSARLRELLSRRHQPADDAAFISIDGRGTDVRVRTGGEYSVERIGFDQGVETLDDAMAAMARILKDPQQAQQLSQRA